jgi:probable HAF family extracellular repeat protein
MAGCPDGTLGGTNSTVAWPNKNDKGQLAGIAETGELDPLPEYWSCALANFPTITGQICQGFIWQNGVMSALAPLSGGHNSYASGINNRGQVVGWAENGVHETTCTPPQVLQFEPVIWGPKLGEITQLPPLSGDLDGAATAINDKGDVVGISGICDQAIGRYTAAHAVIWQNGTPTNIGNFDGGIAWNTPTAINSRGQVVGFANLPDTQNGAFNPVGFIWSKEHVIQEIPPVGTDANNLAWGINDHGQVVGDSCVDNTFSSCRAFLWQHGVVTDLNSLIQPGASLSLVLANDVNDTGEIVGYAVDSTSGDLVAFLAVPSNSGEDRKSAAVHNSQRAVLPESIRLQLRQRVMGRLAAGQ